MPTPSFKTFNSPGGPPVHGTAYIFDVNSGVFRPAYTSDFSSNISMSGITVSVGAVAITGQVPGLSGAFTSFVTGITGSQINIPAGVRNYGIFIESGFGYMNGTLLNAGTMVNGGIGEGWILGSSINVGTTGSTTTSRVIVSWDS